jgi:hypothetical protein
MAGTYTNFLNALGQRESSGNYHAVNQLGYLGKYQMGEGAPTPRLSAAMPVTRQC